MKWEFMIMLLYFYHLVITLRNYQYLCGLIWADIGLVKMMTDVIFYSKSKPWLDKIATYGYLCLLIVPLLNWQLQPIIKSATISFSSLVRSASLTVWSFFFYWHQRWRGWLCRRLDDPFHVPSPNTVFIKWNWRKGAVPSAKVNKHYY